MGTVIAARAASASSTVVAYRLSGFLAMPLAITGSNWAGTFGCVVDGWGGGSVKCAALSSAACARQSPGNALLVRGAANRDARVGDPRSRSSGLRTRGG